MPLRCCCHASRRRSRPQATSNVHRHIACVLPVCCVFSPTALKINDANEVPATQSPCGGRSRGVSALARTPRTPLTALGRPHTLSGMAVSLPLCSPLHSPDRFRQKIVNGGMESGAALVVSSWNPSFFEPEKSYAPMIFPTNISTKISFFFFFFLAPFCLAREGRKECSVRS